MTQHAVQVLDVFQAASFAVQASPFAPDTLALAACLAEEAGLPAAEDVLASLCTTAAVAAPLGRDDAAISSLLELPDWLQ